MRLSGLDALHENIVQLRLISQVNESIRKHFAEDGDLTHGAQKIGAYNYIAAQNSIPSQLRWRIYDYSAFITQLYALYESFVFDVIRQWLSFLPSIYPVWDDLPQKLGSNYRAAIGSVLQKYGGSRTENLTEKSLIEGLYFGVSGRSDYTFISDAFFIGLPNLRKADLIDLCRKVGLPDIDSWFSNTNSALGILCVANSFSVEGQLKNLIEYRNDCAHGPVGIDNLLGANDLFVLGDFVYSLCEVFVEFVQSNICQLAEIQNACWQLGEITEYYKKADAFIIKTKKTSFALGESVIIKSNLRCYYADIISLQKDGSVINTVDTIADDEIGVKLSKPAREGSVILSFKV